VSRVGVGPLICVRTVCMWGRAPSPAQAESKTRQPMGRVGRLLLLHQRPGNHVVQALLAFGEADHDETNEKDDGR
jgi:hypothetical protein